LGFLSRYQQPWVPYTQGLVCALQKKFTSKFNYFTFFKPHPYIKTGAANRWETTNSKPPEPIIMISQLETGTSRQNHIYYTLLWHQILDLRCVLYRLRQTMQKFWAKTILQTQHWNVSTFVDPIFMCSRVTYCTEHMWNRSKFGTGEGVHQMLLDVLNMQNNTFILFLSINNCRN
jgi:hypothetical protein